MRPQQRLEDYYWKGKVSSAAVRRLLTSSSGEKSGTLDVKKPPPGGGEENFLTREKAGDQEQIYGLFFVRNHQKRREESWLSSQPLSGFFFLIF
jgi:hypothetical protein